MKLINQDKNTVLSEDCIVADRFLTRLKGLLGKDRIEKGQALVLNPCNCIHTFFMRFSVDALFIGRDCKVIAAAADLKPFRVSRIYPNACCVIELPAGTIQSTATSIGDSIVLE